MVVLTDESPWKQAMYARRSTKIQIGIDTNNACALHNQRMSPLLKLPGEIRNTIYGYVLGNPRWYVGNSQKKQDAEDNGYVMFNLYRGKPLGGYEPRSSFGSTLLGASRQIHLEAWPLLYSSSTFVVGTAKSFFLWVDSLPDVARLAVSSVSLGGITLDGRVDGTTVDLDVPDYLYPRVSLPPLDVHQLTTFQSSWEYNMLTFLDDPHWILPSL